MNSRTFNAWLRELGYSWVGDEEMVKGFMPMSEAKELITDYLQRGLVRKNG